MAAATWSRYTRNWVRSRLGEKYTPTMAISPHLAVTKPLPLPNRERGRALAPVLPTMTTEPSTSPIQKDLVGTWYGSAATAKSIFHSARVCSSKSCALAEWFKFVWRRQYCLLI